LDLAQPKNANIIPGMIKDHFT